MTCKYLAEFLGTFIFMNCVLSEQPIQIAVGLLASVYVFSGHYNPAVTMMSLLKEEISPCIAVIYIIIQIISAYCALLWHLNLKKKN